VLHQLGDVVRVEPQRQAPAIRGNSRKAFLTALCVGVTHFRILPNGHIKLRFGARWTALTPSGERNMASTAGYDCMAAMRDSLCNGASQFDGYLVTWRATL